MSFNPFSYLIVHLLEFWQLTFLERDEENAQRKLQLDHVLQDSLLCNFQNSTELRHLAKSLDELLISLSTCCRLGLLAECFQIHVRHWLVTIKKRDDQQPLAMMWR